MESFASYRLREAIEENRKQLSFAYESYQSEKYADSIDEACKLSHLYLTDRLLQRVHERTLNLERASTLYEYTLQRLCEDCGEPIPYSRILAQPEATRCCSCQEEFEEASLRRIH